MSDLPPLDDLEEANGPPTVTLAATSALDRLLWEVTELMVDLPVARMSPEERSAMLDLTADLRRVEELCKTKRLVLENLFRAYAAEQGARQIPTADGWLAVEPASGEYKVDIPALRAELVELKAHGLVAQEEIDRALRTVVEERADNAVLNFLARNRGKEVADAIERNRTFVPPDPYRARLTRKRRAR